MPTQQPNGIHHIAIMSAKLKEQGTYDDPLMVV